ncbi:MAG TPA: hypothetical protein VM577_10670 [Anaerovoracaceae bacterium]|nr:hypothetical protein [Anaerovoracaceae bacterium]
MGLEMIKVNWFAPVVPGVELAGIELGAAREEFESMLLECCVDPKARVYKFSDTPLLVLDVTESSGKTFFRFDIFDLNLTGWNLQFPGSEKVLSETRALVVGFLNGRVSNISVWMFDYFGSLGDKRLTYSYQGKVEGWGLGSRVDCAATCFELIYDEAEEWFYARTDRIIFGGGGGGSLEDSEDQLIHMIMIF